MAHHLLPNFPNISKRLYREPAYPNAGTKQHRTGTWLGIISTDEPRGSWKYATGHSRRKVKILEKTGSTWQQYCCSSSSSPQPNSSEEEVNWLVNGKVELNNVVSEHGWKVRKLVAEDGEMRKVAQVQAKAFAFHVPVALLNDFFFQFYQAEVLSGLLYRLRNSPPDRYACLVAESSSDALESPREVVGVVEIRVLRDDNVVQHLQGAEEYLYVSGIAVLNNFRRQKVATVLLKACDMVSILWDFKYLALKAFEDDWGARQLYTNAGYIVVSGDPPWMTTWIGRKRVLLFIKRSNL